MTINTYHPDSALRLNDVRDNDADRAQRLGAVRSLTTTAVEQRMDAYHAFLTQPQYRKQYPMGSAKRAIVCQYLDETCSHYFTERGGHGEGKTDYYMELWAVGHAEAAKNLRAQIKRNRAAR